MQGLSVLVGVSELSRGVCDHDEPHIMLNHIVLLQPEFDVVQVDTTTAVFTGTVDEAKSSWIQWPFRDGVSTCVLVAARDMRAGNVLEKVASNLGVAPISVREIRVS